MKKEKDMLSQQLERMLNQSGILVTPESFEDAQMLQIGSKHEDVPEVTIWHITIGLSPYTIMLKDGVYTVEKV